jgi:hypothetical protein
VGERVASAVWPISAELVLALDARLGPPVDSYVNGSQTWLVEEDAGGHGRISLEYRLHPVGGFEPPAHLSHHDLFEQVVGRLAAGADPGALRLGTSERALTSLWDGLECFVAFSDDAADVEPAILRHLATAALGIAPDLCGLVDHDVIAEEWERTGRRASIVARLRVQLAR